MKIVEFFKIIVNIFQKFSIGRIPGVVAFARVIFRILKPGRGSPVLCQDSRIFIPLRDDDLSRSVYINGVYEPYETELFKRTLCPGMTVIDIGANIGYYSLIASRLVGENGMVYAFEPEPQNFSYLVKNINENKSVNIVPIPKALSDKNGSCKLFIDDDDLCITSLSNRNVSFFSQGFFRRNLKYIDVQCISLDAYIAEVIKDPKKIDIVKIDTEGAEALVVEGADSFLRNCKSSVKIFMEFWPLGCKNVGSDPVLLLDQLRAYGFYINYIDENEKVMRPLDFGTIVKICKADRILNFFLEKGTEAAMP
ncbi:MAG: FkbM family methyltransferase [Candidatus Omnitrophica bacterium]|nr:FkbM family methyltransferase [Candidatus Omnitrophota bacterium]